MTIGVSKLRLVVAGISAVSVVSVVVLLAAAAIFSDDGTDAAGDVVPLRPTATARSSQAQAHTVEYRITTTGSPRMNLTMRNAQGGTEQHLVTATNGVWSQTFRMEPGTSAYVSAQNRGESGTISCEISVNGEILQSATSTGGHVIATCSGIVGD